MSEDHTSVAAPIDAVTVYRRGAVVQRSGTLHTLAGTARIGGLPLCLLDESVVARVQGPGAPVVTDVRVALEVTDIERADPPEVAAVLAARAAERRAHDHRDRLEARHRHVAALSSPDRPEGKRGEAPPRIPVEGRLALLAYRAERLEALAAELALATRDAERATNEREAVEHALHLATTARPPREHELRKAAVLTLHGGTPGAGPWTLTLEYQVPGARWSPSYVLRFDAALAQVQVELRAAVAQRSGEDWTGVSLTVSSALPMPWTELPELPALRIGRRQPPPPPTGWREPPQGADGLYADYRRVAGALGPPPRPAPPPPPPPQEEPDELLDIYVGAEPEPELATRAEAKVKRRRAAPPSAPPSAPPAPVPAAMAPPPMPQAAPARSASLFSRVAEAGAAMAPSGGAALPPAARAAAPAEPPPPAALTAPADLLDYGRLRLAGADGEHPGQLRPAPVLQLLEERIVVQQVVVDRRLLTVLDGAVARADLAGLALPPGQSEPGPVQDFHHAWRAEHTIDLPSDGTWHSLGLQRASGKAARRLVVVPREGPEAFRFATFDNPLDAPLPAGPADVFVGGDLLLTTPLRATDRGGRVRLGLGVEEGLKVARNTRFAERTTGLLGGSLSLAHQVEVELVNNLAEDARVEVRERIPVTREDDDEVKVTDVRAEPPWEAWEQPERPVRGAHRWVLVVPAGERRTLTARYTVELSAKRELVGGNRREGR